MVAVEAIGIEGDGEGLPYSASTNDTITNEGDIEATATATAEDLGVQLNLLAGAAVGNASTTPTATAIGVRGGGGVDSITNAKEGTIKSVAKANGWHVFDACKTLDDLAFRRSGGQPKYKFPAALVDAFAAAVAGIQRRARQ